MTQQNTRLGIWLMVLTTLIFSVQDAFSRLLAETYSPFMIVMVRYWVFALFVLALARLQAGSLKAAARTHHPILQSLRGLLLITEIIIMVFAFAALGLVETHAVFTCYPLLVAALSGPILGEKVGWRRWSAISLGLIGVLVILNPGGGIFAPAAILPLIAAALFAVYSLLTRYVSRKDSSTTSFFWTGVVGALASSAIGIFYWQPFENAADLGAMLGLCLTALSSHWMLIKCYEVAEASAVQPFAFLQVGFVSIIGVVFFAETLEARVLLGGAIVIAAGLFTLLREKARASKH